MKTDGNFKLSKQAKCMLASVTDKKERDSYKSFLIDAEATRTRLERVILKGNEKE